MARLHNKLSARTVATITKPGRHSDGGGLYLSIDRDGRRRWVFLFTWAGKLREMGIGPHPAIGLADARDRAGKARKLLADGVNPLAVRREQTKVPTFGEAADELLASINDGFRNEKHQYQWKATLTNHCSAIRSVPVDQIGTAEVLSVLQPLWTKTPETASRLRGRIERVLDAAKAQGHRSGENPARWRGHLAAMLPKRQKLTRGHHKAMPYPVLPAFIDALRARPATAARALEFAILTAARTGEALGARWAEIDLDAALWTIPAERMKAGREHQVPLVGRALELVKEMAVARSGAFVFPGQKRGEPLSAMAMEMILRRMEVDVTVHGFRSSFRDWAGNETDHAREVAEEALAHVIPDATERAYRRSAALKKREALLKDWGAHCEPKANVTAIG